MQRREHQCNVSEAQSQQKTWPQNGSPGCAVFHAVAANEGFDPPRLHQTSVITGMPKRSAALHRGCWRRGGFAARLSAMPSSRSYSEQVAGNLLNRYGLAAIWQLHVSAAAAYRKG